MSCSLGFVAHAIAMLQPAAVPVTRYMFFLPGIYVTRVRWVLRLETLRGRPHQHCTQDFLGGKGVHTDLPSYDTIVPGMHCT